MEIAGEPQVNSPEQREKDLKFFFLVQAL
jgi:hypothetical protein